MTPEMHRIRLYKEVTNKINEMGQHVLALTRHPDTSCEQLTQAHRLYSDSYNHWMSVGRKLQTKYPEYKGKQYNWKTNTVHH